jgi:amino acid permease
MLWLVIIAFIAFAAVHHFMATPDVQKICRFGMIICVIALAVLVVLHFAGIAPATWPYGVRP